MGASSRWQRSLPDKPSLVSDKLLYFLELYVILYIIYCLSLTWNHPFTQESLFILGVTGKLSATRLVLISRPFYKKFFFSLKIKSSYCQFQCRASTLPKISVPNIHIILICFISQYSYSCTLKNQTQHYHYQHDCWKQLLTFFFFLQLLILVLC